MGARLCCLLVKFIEVNFFKRRQFANKHRRYWFAGGIHFSKHICQNSGE